MSSSPVTNVIAATELAFGRNASWEWITDPDAYTYDPNTGDDPNDERTNTGISVLSAVSAFVLASVRYAPNRRTTFHTIDRDVYDAAESYELVLNGTDTYTTTGETTAEDAAADLVAQINAAASANTDPRAVAVASTTDNVLDTVMVYAYGVPSTATAPVLAVEANTTHGDGVAVAFPSYGDSEGFSIRLWGLYRTPARGIPQGMSLPWVLLADGDIGPITSSWTDRINVAALERLYVEVYDVIANPDDTDVLPRANLLIGKAIAES